MQREQNQKESETQTTDVWTQEVKEMQNVTCVYIW